ncbi:erythromycin esterase family protein [Gemmatimonas sp.]|uniref:erythromycin esterase family protein n=1 Tax=Gemmatimonas sp. TaxID=1962908 RepID=UPI003342DDC0
MREELSPVRLLISALVAANIFLCSGCGGQARYTDSARGEGDKRAKQFAELLIPIALDSAGRASSSDLARVVEAVGRPRAVLLSEQAHGDGATIALNAELAISFHREGRAQLLATESGLFDAEETWANRFRAHRGGRYLEGAVHGTWSATAQFAPVLNYVQTTIHSLSAFQLAGFDNQLTGPVAQQEFANKLRAAVTEMKIDTAALEDWNGGMRILDSLLHVPGNSQRWTAEQERRFVRLFNSLENMMAADEKGRRRVHFWRQMMRSTRSYGLQHFRSVFDSVRGEIGDVNIRDAQMAENFLWLLEDTSVPGAIVWAAALHGARDLTAIESGDTAYVNELHRYVPMGAKLASVLGSDYFAIGTLAVEGSTGHSFVGGPEWNLPRPESGSLEALFAQLPFDAAFLPLRNLPPTAQWLLDSLWGRPFGYAPVKAVWPRLFDGLIFIRRQHPTTSPQVRGETCLFRSFLAGKCEQH